MLKEIVEEIKKANKRNVDKIDWQKIPTVEPGDKIEVVWKDYGEDYVDTGYCFCLPGLNFDEGSFMIHFATTQNPGGIGEGDEVYIHSYNLASNKKVKEVRAAK